MLRPKSTIFSTDKCFSRNFGTVTASATSLPDGHKYKVGRKVSQAFQVAIRTFSFETRAAIDSQVVHVTLVGKWWREIRCGGAVDAVHMSANRGCDVHQSRVVAYRLLYGTEEINDIGERGLAA